MPALSRIIRIETHHGTPVQSNGLTVTPVARLLVIDLGQLAFIRNHPAHILVEDGETRRRLPIPDPTGLLLAALALFALTLAAYGLFHKRRA